MTQRIFSDNGEPLLLIDRKVTYQPKVFPCVVQSGATERNIFWKNFHRLHTSSWHVFQKFWCIWRNAWVPEHLRGYLEWLNHFMPLYPEKDELHCVHFFGSHSITDFYLSTVSFGMHRVTPIDYLANLWVNKDLVIWFEKFLWTYWPGDIFFWLLD